MPDPTRTQTASVPPLDAVQTTEAAAIPSQVPLDADASDALRFAPPTHPGDLGRLGRYRILKRLGAGGMGAVYLANDETLGRSLALKVMLPKFAAHPQAKARFLREARTAARVRSNHVIAILDVDELDGVPFIAMEYLQGIPLDGYLSKHSGLSVPQILRFSLEVAQGLAAAHEIGLVHRDIKPANLFLESPHGRVKILDFGLAKESEPDDEGGVTRTGQVVGTPAYMSPEQARGEPVDARSDLFSLGVVLYKLSTGKQPFRGPTPMAVLMSLGMDEPTPVRELNPAVPSALAELIRRLLSKKPEDRPQTAVAVHAALTALEDGNSVPEGNATTQTDYIPIDVPIPAGDGWGWVGESAESNEAVTHELARKPRKSFPWLATVGAVGAVLVAGVLVMVVLNPGKPKPEVVAELPDPEPTKPPTPSEQPKQNPDRKAAEVLHPHCTLRLLLASGKEVSIAPSDSLPTEPYALLDLRLEHSSTINRETFFTTIADLRRLDRFDDGYNRLAITDAELARLARMPLADTLTHLSVPNVQLTPATVSDLSRFKLLRHIQIATETADDAVLKQLAQNHPALATLILMGLGHSGRVTADGFAAIARLPLQSLWFARCNHIPRAWCEQIARMPKLQALRFQYCAVDDDSAAALVGSKITSFTCGGPESKLTDAGMESLAKVATLQILDLDGTSVTDIGLERLTTLKNLTSLVVLRTKVTMAGIMKFKAAVPGCAIKSNVYDAKLDPDRVAAEWLFAKGGSSVAVAGVTLWVTKAADLPAGPLRVTEFNLGSTTYLMNDEDIELLVPLTALTSFASGISNITDAGLEKLSRLPSAERLTTLNLSGSKFTDDGLKHLSRFRSLSTLSIGYFTKVTGKGFAVLHELPALTKLFLGSSATTDEGLLHLKGLNSLTHLDLRLTNVTDEGIELIADLPKLTSLGLASTKITDKGLEPLARAKKLTALYVGNTKVTAEGIAAFKKAVPACNVTSGGQP